MRHKIGFIASDIEMEKMLISLYPELVASEELLIEVFDNNSVTAQGERMVKAGADIIIARSGGYLYNEGRVSVPLLKLKISTGDLILALHKASEISNVVDLFLWDQINYDLKIFEIIDVKVNIHLFSGGEEIEALYNAVVGEDYRGVVVGGGVVCSLSRRSDIPYIFINPSEDSIREIMDYARDILKGILELRYQNELLTTVVQGGYDGVLAIDTDFKVTIFNKRAEDILSKRSENIMGNTLEDVFPEFKFLKESLANRTEENDKLLKYHQMTLTYNTSMIYTDQEVKGLLMSFQDITKLQRLEQKIRYELSDKGLVGKYTFDDVIYKGQAMADVVKKAKIIAKSNSTAIIYGESGTGKEIIASSMHNLSNRRFGPFVAVNCAALSESLLESELFGYEGGAFTGARKGGKPGLFELAHQGTIFLDEINSMSLATQAKLLRVVEQKDVMRIGSDRVIPLDVRIICAANESLSELVKTEKFRKDLFYRLNSLEVYLPTLKERPEDIPALVSLFLEDDSDYGINQMPDEKTLEKMLAYDWPGNVRELRSVCERYKLFGEVDLGDRGDMADESHTKQLVPEAIDLKEIHKLVEKQVINQLLAGGMSKTDVATFLGISRTVLWRKMNE